MVTDKDKPTVHSTTSSLDADAKVEPYVHATRGGKRITFPDPFEMEFEEAEEFMASLEGVKSSEVLRRWLSDGEYDLLKDDHLTLRQMMVLTQKVQAHYEAWLGDQGNGGASAS